MPRLPGESGCGFQDRPAGIGFVARARDAFRAIGLHQRPPVGLLVVGDLDHVDFDFEAEQRAGEGERRAPLSRARLGRELRHALFLVVEGLGDGGVGFVAAGGADALVFVENARARAERLLEPPGAVERRRAPHPIDVADRLRDLDVPFAAHFLADQRHRKEGREIVRPDRLARSRVQHRRAADDGRSATMLYQAWGIWSSPKKIFGLVAHAFLPAGSRYCPVRAPRLTV